MHGSLTCFGAYMHCCITCIVALHAWLHSFAALHCCITLNALHLLHYMHAWLHSFAALHCCITLNALHLLHNIFICLHYMFCCIVVIEHINHLIVIIHKIYCDLWLTLLSSSPFEKEGKEKVILVFIRMNLDFGMF